MYYTLTTTHEAENDPDNQHQVVLSARARSLEQLREAVEAAFAAVNAGPSTPAAADAPPEQKPKRGRPPKKPPADTGNTPARTDKTDSQTDSANSANSANSADTAGPSGDKEQPSEMDQIYTLLQRYIDAYSTDDARRFLAEKFEVKKVKEIPEDRLPELRAALATALDESPETDDEPI